MRGMIMIVLLLGLVLALCLLGLWYITDSAGQLAALFPGLRLAILNSDWQRAETVFGDCRRQWEQISPIWRVLINHEDMRDIEVALVDLESALNAQHGWEAEKELADLDFFLRHVPETERVSWDNIL